MSHSLSFSRCLVLVLPCVVAVSFADDTRIALAAPAPCSAPRTLVVIDDQLNQPAWMTEQARAFRLESPAAAVRSALAGKPCMVILDPDPIFSTIPGAVVPELVVRVRLLDLKGTERNFARRASDAVGRYVSSYLGGSGEGIPVLRQVELGGELLCARGRNLLHSAGAKGGDSEEAGPEDNRKRLDDAAAQLAGLLQKSVADAPLPCDTGTAIRTLVEKE